MREAGYRITSEHFFNEDQKICNPVAALWYLGIEHPYDRHYLNVFMYAFNGDCHPLARYTVFYDAHREGIKFRNIIFGKRNK